MSLEALLKPRRKKPRNLQSSSLKPPAGSFLECFNSTPTKPYNAGNPA